MAEIASLLPLIQGAAAGAGAYGQYEASMAQGRFGLELPESLAMHAAVYEGIVARDVAKAKTALDGVLKQASSEVVRLMQERGAARGKRTAA